MSDIELRGWLRLLETPGIGRQTARKLLASFGSPDAVFLADPAALAALPATVARAVSHEPAHLGALFEATLRWLEAGTQRHVITLGDPRYPQQLYQGGDPPLLLYVDGRLALLQALSVAVVGSRNPSAQGQENARAFAAALSQAGITVVSGLARGIDAAAHEGALGAVGADLMGLGSTIAVVGTGLDQVYPRHHGDLAARIAAEGLMVSEYAIGTPPLAAHFPPRNRIIAGLSRGTLVVEAALKSGSLITARLATEAGREVFAVPGSIHQPQSRGCHALIKQGAKLVESTEDILEELRGGNAGIDTRPSLRGDAPGGRRATIASNASSTSTVLRTSPSPVSRPNSVDLEADPNSNDPILQALGHETSSLDALQLRTGWSTSDLSVHLLTLELSGVITRLPGQLFQRVFRA